MSDTTTLAVNMDHRGDEALVLYRQMRADKPSGDLPLYLTDTSAAEEASRLQETRRVESTDDAMIGKVQAWLDRPMTTGSLDDEDEGKVRTYTCLTEIWLGLGNDERSYNQIAAQTLGRVMSRMPNWRLNGGKRTFKNGLGRQRFYERISTSS